MKFNVTRSSLAIKLVMPLTLLTLCVGGLGTACASWMLKDRLRAEADRRAELLINAVTNAVEAADSSERRRIVLSMGGERDVKLILVAAGEPPRVVASTRNAWNGKLVSELPPEFAKEVAAGAELTRLSKSTSDNGDVFTYTRPLLLSRVTEKSRQLAGGVLTIHLDASPIRQGIQEATLVIGGFTMAIASVIALVAYLIIYRTVISPIRWIVNAMQRRTEGDRNAYACVCSRDEIGEVAQSLNHMIDELEARVQEANLARQHAEAADKKLAEVAMHLALPPRDLESIDTFSIDEFTLNDMMVCGAAVRGLSRHVTTIEHYADALADFLYERFRDERLQREFEEIRVYQTATDEAGPLGRKRLELLAAAGDNQQPASDGDWESLSERDLTVVPLDCSAMAGDRELVRQLLDLGMQMPGGSEATRTGRGEAADDSGATAFFFAKESVQSAIGFGGRLPNGDIYVVIGFARKKIELDVAQRFSHLSHSALIGMLPFLPYEPKTVAQIQAFDSLLQNHERIVSEQEQHLRTAISDLTRSNLELEQFAYVASHDLQEPLRKVSAFCELFQHDYADRVDEEGRRYIDYIVDGARRMRTLIQDLLAYSRVNSDGRELTDVDAQAAVEDAIRNLHGAIEEHNAEVRCASLPTVRGDARQLTQLFQNLIGNAIKYHGDREPEVDIRLQEGPEGWIISIEDNGIGIDPEYHDRIFGIFKRLHARNEYPGTGIGLAICRRIVERMNGRIWVDSEVGQGSAFRFTLPM